MDAGKWPSPTNALQRRIAPKWCSPRPPAAKKFKDKFLSYHGLAPVAVPVAWRLLGCRWTRKCPWLLRASGSSQGQGSRSSLPPTDALPSGWKDSASSEIVFPRSKPKRFVHFLGGAFVGVSPRLFYEGFLQNLAENCEAIVIATPYQLSFDYDAMADAAAARFERTVSQLTTEYPVCTDLPVVAVGHSCGALLHALLACAGADYQACVLMSFNNKPISDAIPVPLPDSPRNLQLRELARSNLEALLADENIEETLKTAKAVLQNVGVDASGSNPELAQRAAPVVSQFGPLLGSVVDGKKEFSISREEIFDRLSSAFPVRTLVVQFANDFTDDSNDLTSCIQLGGQEVKLLRFPGGHTSPLDPPVGGQRQERLSSNIASFLSGKDLGGVEAQEISALRDKFLRLSAGYNRGFGPLPPDDRSDIIACIEELEALSGQTCQRSGGQDPDALMPKLAGKWRLIWATSPDVLLLTSLPLAECGEIRQEIEAPATQGKLKVVNSVELSPKGAGLLGATLPDVARALTVVSKVEATAVSSGATLILQLEKARLERATEPALPGLLQLLPPIELSTASSVKLLTTFLDNELRIARSPFGDVFIFSRL